jgi:hypothetical protein
MRKTFLAFLILALANPCFAKYSGGSGDPNDPYKIANVADFNQLSSTPADFNKSFILTTNINLTGLTFTQAPIAPDSNSVTSGFQGTKFTGVFDGNSHIISNLTIIASTKDYIGVFGYVGSGGKLRNLCIENAYVIGNSYVGGLVGGNSGLLTSCYMTGLVSGDANSIGGLVGGNNGTITSCYVTGSVTGTDTVGGLVGSNSCHEMVNPTLTACYATGSVTGDSSVGGLVGSNSGSIISCYATGSISGDSDIGGLVGLFEGGGTLALCYATGSVTGTDRVGGLVGFNHAMLNICYTNLLITSCYSTGMVTGSSSVGGLVGSNICENWGHLTITACFWDIQTSDQTVGVGFGTSTGVTGKTTDQMKTLSTFTLAGWDFSTTDGDPADWMMPADSYPRLAWEHIAGNIADLNGDGVVNYLDLAILVEQWLFDEIPADLAPLPDGDGTVDFADFSFFANQWGTTNGIDELFDFTKQWLKIGLPICSADISPSPGGDGRVNEADFAMMANHWLEGF